MGNGKGDEGFRGCGAHAKVMPHLANGCDEAAYAHWGTTGETVPPGLGSTSIY